MINQAAVDAGHFQQPVHVKLSPFYLAMIKHFKNTQSNNFWIVIKETTLALEVGCMKVTNT